MQNDITSKQLRSFGLIVGGIFLVIGLWPMVVYGTGYRFWALILAALLILPALVFPRSLAHVHRAWLALGHGLGWINARIILGFVFYVLVTPIGQIRRWMGKDPVGRSFRPDLSSYRIPRTTRPPSDMTKQY